MSQPCDLHSLWIGPRLGLLQKLSLASWLAHGHRAVIWVYGAVDGLPRDADIRDAREILPESAISYHRASGSVSLFSNRFRYHLFRQHPSSTWFDMDILLLRPFTEASPYWFAWEIGDSICSAVLRLPARSCALRDLLTLTDARVPVPHWWPLKERNRQRWRGLFGEHTRAEDLTWGTFGPRALTETLKRRNLAGRAFPRDTFYSIDWTETPLFYEQHALVEERLGPEAIGVHLWSTGGAMWSPEVLAKREGPLAPASWIARQCRAYGVDWALA